MSTGGTTGRALSAACLVSLTVVAASHAQSASAGLLISTAALAAALNDPALVLIQVAERESAFEEAHIPGARFVRYADLAVDGPDGVGTELPPADRVKRVFEAVGVSTRSRVVLYSPSTVAAARAFFTLDAMGHPRVALLDGGLRAWRAENRPVATGAAPAPAKGSFSPTLNPARLESAKQIQQHMAKQGIALVDVRPDPEYLGTDGGMSMHAPGHIEGARQLPWDTLVGPDGRFLTRDQLQARLAAAGVVSGKPVVSYCMVGMRASVVYFVARYLGYDARLYDGSIVDWSQRKLPLKLGRQ